MKWCKCSLLLHLWVSDQILESSHGQHVVFALCKFIISNLNMKGNCYELLGFLCVVCSLAVKAHNFCFVPCPLRWGSRGGVQDHWYCWQRLGCHYSGWRISAEKERGNGSAAKRLWGEPGQGRKRPVTGMDLEMSVWCASLGSMLENYLLESLISSLSVH